MVAITRKIIANSIINNFISNIQIYMSIEVGIFPLYVPHILRKLVAKYRVNAYQDSISLISNYFKNSNVAFFSFTSKIMAILSRMSNFNSGP